MKSYQFDPKVQRIVQEAVKSGVDAVNQDTMSRIVYLQQNREAEFTQPMSADELMRQLGLTR